MDNGPGCDDGLDVDEQECAAAAEKLGFIGSFKVGSWDHAPPGCFVGHPGDNWTKIYFNKIAKGTLGQAKYKSICMKEEQGT